jgi:ADP-heptose:LPS heptosyltransferase
MHASIRHQTIIKSFFNIYNTSLPVLPNSEKYCPEVKKLIKNKAKLNVAVCVKGRKNSPHVYDINNFKKVILLIDEHFNHDTSFYLVWTKENFDYSQQVVVSDNVYNICGKISLLQLRDFLKLTDLLISVDTGVVHVAATTKTNVLSITSSADSVIIEYKHYHTKLFVCIKSIIVTLCDTCILKRGVNDFKCKSYPTPECLKQIS